MEKTFCALPFTQLVLHPDGNVTPCCFLRNYILGNIRDKSLSEIRNGEKARALRREFLSGELTTCQSTLDVWHCDKHNRHIESFVEVSEVQSTPPRKLDVRLNGHCNLECIMCDVWPMPNGVYDLGRFWEEAERDIFPGLLEIDVLGGEPFIQKDTYRLIDVITRVNPGCKWMFTTNGHWKFTPYIRNALDKLVLRWITVSVDSLLPAVYSAIRLKGDLKRTLTTLDDLLRYRDERIREGRGFPIILQTVIQKRNLAEVPEFVRFASEHGLQLTLIPMHGGPNKDEGILLLPRNERGKHLLSLLKLYDETKCESLQTLIRALEKSVFDDIALVRA